MVKRVFCELGLSGQPQDLQTARASHLQDGGRPMTGCAPRGWVGRLFEDLAYYYT